MVHGWVQDAGDWGWSLWATFGKNGLSLSNYGTVFQAKVYRPSWNVHMKFK